jgi:hypothetical protein
MEGKTTELSVTRSTVRPKFIYCCRYYTDQLLRTNLLTGEQSCHKIPGYEFKIDFRWSELPGGSLLITGGFEGYISALSEVLKIDTLRDWAVSSLPPMTAARSCHAAVYHSQFLYVLGGVIFGRYLSECERYVCAESRWEVLPALP